MTEGVLILVTLMLASGTVWCLWLAGHFTTFNSLIEATEPKSVGIWNPLATAMVVYLVARSTLLKFYFAEADEPRTLTLLQLQSSAVLGLAEIAVLLGILSTASLSTLREYGFRFNPFLKQLGLGGVSFVASLLPVYLLLLVTSPLRSTETLHPFLKFLQNQPTPETILWIGVLVVLIAPLLEELIYRVVLQTALVRWLPKIVALPLTAVLFSVVHGWPDAIPLFPLALILGWVYDRYRSYLAVVTIHALFNLWMLFWALFI